MAQEEERSGTHNARVTTPERTVDEENQLQREQLLTRSRQARDAFLATFGPPGKRTPLGDIMLRYLDRFCKHGGLLVEQDAHGATDVPRTFRNMGRWEVMQAIHDIINWKESDHAHGSGST